MYTSFSKKYNPDNISSAILFSDGAAAMLVTGNNETEGLNIDHFYSSVSFKSKQEMVWELSSTGFLLTLSGYIPELIEEDFNGIVNECLKETNLNKRRYNPLVYSSRRKKILEAVHNSLGFTNGQLQPCYDVLSEYGNMSSPTILFVLKRIQQALDKKQPNNIFGAAFGPGLTIETFILST